MPTSNKGHLIPFDMACGTVCAFGLNYADHLREAGEKAGQPALFVKGARGMMWSSVRGH